MKPLSLDQDSLINLSREDLLEAVKDWKNAIRYHRDQLGDDRCWLDDGTLFGLFLL